MTTPILSVKNLRAGYGRAEVLHGINLQADKGSVITVIGPNGAGKSTLLNTLMGILPGRGSIEFNGQPIDALTLEELVPERRELFGTMSVEDNLVLGAFRQVRQHNKQWRAQMDVVFDLFPRLKERRAQEAGTLSGGERQMLAVGRALMSRPVLLMLDEPSLGLAPLIVKEIFRTIDGLRKTGVTTLLVEQNARAALETADYGYVLEMGEIALQGNAADLATDPRVIETYLGAAKKKPEPSTP
jgi:branched-chain amino acid transport system ATP-binding protein